MKTASAREGEGGHASGLQQTQAGAKLKRPDDVMGNAHWLMGASILLSGRLIGPLKTWKK